MTEQTQEFVRELFIAAFSVFLTATFGVVAWATLDRQHWAAKEQVIDDNSEAVRTLQGKIDALPQSFATRKEFEQVRDLIQNDHIETLNALQHLGDRIDNLARMSGVQPSQLIIRPGKPDLSLAKGN
jgi:hypothetical protein